MLYILLVVVVYRSFVVSCVVSCIVFVVLRSFVVSFVVT